jgi:hypothetical protein
MQGSLAMIANQESWPKWPMVEWLSVATAVAIGPVFMVGGYQMNLAYGAGGAVYLLVCATVVPVLVVFGGRFRSVVRQLAAVSLALSVFVDNFRLEADPFGHLKELTGIGFLFWLMTSVVSGPVPLAYFVHHLTSRKKGANHATH